jgi:hypothetical protein
MTAYAAAQFPARAGTMPHLAAALADARIVVFSTKNPRQGVARVITLRRVEIHSSRWMWVACALALAACCGIPQRAKNQEVQERYLSYAGRPTDRFTYLGAL